MTKLKSLVAKLAVAGIATFAFAAPSYAIDGMSVEYGTGNSTQLVRLGAQWNWGQNWNFWQSNGTHIGGYWDLSVANWRMNHYNNTSSSGNLVDIGLTPVFRFQRDDGRGPYAEAGIGVHLFSKLYRNNDKVLSTAFQFGDHIGAGYVFANGVDVGIRLQHFSNGGIKQPNGGVNFAVARVAYKF